MKSTIANDGKRSAFESNLGDVADALAAPQHTAKQQNFLDIKAHFWKKCQVCACCVSISLIVWRF